MLNIINKKYSIEVINDGNWRPGMPKEGFIVRYDSDDSFGLLRVRYFGTLEDAQSFAETIE